jgi:hypothetical protein
MQRQINRKCLAVAKLHVKIPAPTNQWHVNRRWFFLAHFAPPALGECSHGRLARCSVAVGGVRSSWCPKAKVHIHGLPMGAAFTLKMRPTTSPFASTL